MDNKDLAQTVNAFMLANAPTLTEATPMAYDLLKSMATQLVFTIKTTKEHALYVMSKKYGHLYHPRAITAIIDEAFADEISNRLKLSKDKKERKRHQVASSFQPVLLSA